MSVVPKHIAHFEKLCQSRTRLLVLMMVLTVLAVVGLGNFTLSPGNGSSYLFPLLGFGKTNLSSHSPSGAEGVAQVHLSADSKDSSFPSREMENRVEVPLARERVKHHRETSKVEQKSDEFHIDDDGEQEEDSFIDFGNDTTVKIVKDPFGGYITIQMSGKEEKDSSVGMGGKPGIGFNASTSMEGAKTNSSLELFEETNHSYNNSFAPPFLPYRASSYIDKDTNVQQHRNSSILVINVVSNKSSSGEKKIETVTGTDERVPLRSGKKLINCRVARDHAKKKKRKGAAMTISDMNHLLSETHASSCLVMPQWSSENDLQLLDAKKQITNAPVVKSDPELYPAIFRNISMFKRSYELMESMLKIYVYKEGEKPIFHQPELSGIYSSEGWFMKHMEGSRQFVVDDPRKAHLFYIPFGSNLLRSKLYVPGSHNYENLVEYLETYVDTIAAKYPFWNRTCGADHFVVACDDWATYETGRAMGTSIRAVCNADVTEDFELGKDVSLPETFVRNRENPLEDLGGKVANRPILAFFAGHLHGYLRPILVQHWENKDPEMKIFGPKKVGGKKDAAYIQYMKSSRYCICPRGYEVNSPRVVEAIFYECIPVIISDNFVPPFFEVLDWEAFSVVLPEKDVPRLKQILVSIPRRKYLRLYMGVRKVQQHFLWHRQPVKYDLFHMILHSIWFNRVFQLRVS